MKHARVTCVKDSVVWCSLAPKLFSARKIPKISRIPKSGVRISGWGGTLYFREFRDLGFVPEPKCSLNVNFKYLGNNNNYCHKLKDEL